MSFMSTYFRTSHPAYAELVSCGPRPLPLRGGAQALRPTTLLPSTSGQQADRKDLGKGIFMLLNQRLVSAFQAAFDIVLEVIDFNVDG